MLCVSISRATLPSIAYGPSSFDVSEHPTQLSLRYLRQTLMEWNSHERLGEVLLRRVVFCNATANHPTIIPVRILKPFLPLSAQWSVAPFVFCELSVSYFSLPRQAPVSSSFSLSHLISSMAPCSATFVS